MFWVGHTHDGITILERCYNTLEEAQQDVFFQKGTHIYSVYNRGAVIVETNDPDQWERDNNPGYEDYFCISKDAVQQEEVKFFVFK